MLSLCFPTRGRSDALRVNSQGVVLATDEVHRLLLEFGWHVDVASLASATDHRLFRSRLPLQQIDDVDTSTYDLVWHMFRDPTQPEVVERLERLRLEYGRALLINDALDLKQHHKHHYLPILGKLGIAVEVCGDDLKIANWNKTTCAWTSRGDGRWIATHAYNADRQEYAERGHGRIVTRYVDNARDGFRSFVRFGYALGDGFTGFEYRFPADRRAMKTGGASAVVPYTVPVRYRAAIRAGLEQLGCDVCHVEAIPCEDGLRIFDVNPSAMANGRTLTPISAALVKVIDRKVRQRARMR